MSVRIALNNQPEFYTNLDEISGRVLLGINRSEQISSIVVKLEGEAVTALQVPHPTHPADINRTGPPPGPPGSLVAENHKILYKVSQVFPDEYYASSSNPYGAHPLHPGEHVFPFKFKLPLNNACSDQMAMSKIGGIGGLGGFGSGGGLFGMGGVRVMDGSKQLFLRHVTKTLPPSLTAFPGECEIRYYVKVTISRPGLLKENWRYQIGFKFLPIEPPRPKPDTREAFAKRPFTFRPRSPQPDRRKTGLFSKKGEDKGPTAPETPPSIEVSARLPYPSILTCNKPIPLRLVAKKLVNSPEQVYLSSLQVDLIGTTELRSHTIFNRKVNRWVVTSANNIKIPLCTNTDDKDQEFVIPDDIWRNVALPNTVAPSFTTCNLSRKYELELKLGVSWGRPTPDTMSKNPFSSSQAQPQPQTIWLPLHFGNIEVYSGITPPPELVEAARNTRPGAATVNIPPRLPPRTNTGSVSGASNPRPSQPVRPQNQTVTQPPITDPLYPPQLAAGQDVPPPDDAPPSYDDAMAENLTGPFDGMQNRPAYSGVTNENAPSQMPQTKN